ncbi:hypothetical protein F2Q69_00032672 [Brassica cretica]|uniref:Uncharacterized protein n=1 Tax=Brassica cretica TaxID=69181 RepID=A0A8S9SH22_BRACR|nr:hypothetical protein F2Q69_00032672 [Brassica cretica]
MQGTNNRKTKQIGPTVAEGAHSVGRKTLLAESTLPNQLEGKWQSSSKIMTRSRSSYQTAQRAMPYSKGSLGKMTQNVKNLLSKAQGNQALQSLIKHSHSLLR